MIKIKSQLQYVWLLFVLLLILGNNPALFSSRPLFDREHRANHQILSVLIDEAPNGVATQPQSNYRVDDLRTGFDTKARFKAVHPKKLWSALDLNQGIHGASKASPAVDESGIYIGSDAGLFSKYDWQGMRAWTWWVPDNGRGIHSTASLDQAAVYFGAYDGKFRKVDKTSGRLIWVTKVADAVGGSPLLTSNALYLGAETASIRDGFALKLDPATGRVLWRSERFHEQTHSSPVLDEKTKSIYIGANDFELRAVDEASGALKWSFKGKGEIKSTPVLIGHEVCFTDWGKQLECVDVETRKQSFHYEFESASQVSPSYSIEHDRLLVADNKGFFYAFAWKEKRLLWKKQLANFNNMGSATLVTIAGRLHFISACRETSWCVGDVETGDIKFEAKSEGRLTGVPVIWNDRLILSFNTPGALEVWQL